MAWYRKRPLRVQAVMIRHVMYPDFPFKDPVATWVRQAHTEERFEVVLHHDNHHSALYIDTPTGPQRGLPGDYLVQGVNGELYSCDCHVFESRYELVEWETM